MMKKRRNILKTIKSNKKYRAILIGIGCFSSVVMVMVALMFTNSVHRIVEDSKKAYGSYAFSLDSADTEVVSKLKANSNIKDVYLCNRSSVDKDGKLFNYYKIEDELLEELGYHILSGEYPAEEDEILLDYNYVLDRNLEKEKVVGTYIELPDEDGKKNISYRVSGIFSYKEVLQGEEKESIEYFFIHKGGNENNALYVTLNDYNNYWETINQIIKEESISTYGECYPNLGLYCMMGYPSGVSVFQYYHNLYYFIALLILVSLCIIIYNVAKLCLLNQYQKISVMNLLGIPNCEITISYLMHILCQIGVGLLSGIVLATAIGYGYASVSFGMSEAIDVIFTHYPVALIASTVMLTLVATSLVMLPMVIKLMKLSPMKFIHSKNAELVVEKKKFKKHMLTFKTTNCYKKLARNNIGINKLMYGFACLSVACAIVCILMGGYYIRLMNVAYHDNSDQFYRIEFGIKQTLFHKEENESEIPALTTIKQFSDGVIKSTTYEESCEVRLQRETLSKNYLDYMYQSSRDKAEMLADFSKDTRIFAKVIAYDDKTYQEVLKENGIRVEDSLTKDGALILDTIYSDCNPDTFATAFQSGDILNLKKRSLEEDKEIALTVSHVVHSLPIYPRECDYVPVIIVTKAMFTELFGQSVPNYIYIKDQIKEDSEDWGVINVLEASKDITMSYPIKELKEKNEINRVERVTIYFIAALLLLIAIVLILSNLILRVYSKRHEYVLLRALGYSNEQIMKVIRYELRYIILVGIPVGVTACYFVTRSMYLDKFTTMGIYLYKFPYVQAIVTSGLVCAIITLLAIPIKRRIKKLPIIETLNQSNE